jgi:NTE family protein
VDVITGVSGGSFTALAYGLYGEKLFDEYEDRFAQA